MVLLRAAEKTNLDELQRARADLLRARVAFAVNRGNDAPALLLRAAQRFGPLDANWHARPCWTPSSRPCSPDGWRAMSGLQRVAEAARRTTMLVTARPRLISSGRDRAADHRGPKAAAPPLRQALLALRTEEAGRSGSLAVAGLACRNAVVGRRKLGCVVGPAGRARPPNGRSQRATDRPARPHRLRIVRGADRGSDHVARRAGRPDASDQQRATPLWRRRTGRVARPESMTSRS